MPKEPRRKRPEPARPETSARRLSSPALPQATAAEAEAARQRARDLGLTFSTAGELMPRMDPTMARRIPRRFLERIGIVPICRQGEEIVVATSRATQDDIRCEIDNVLGEGRLVAHLVTPSDLRRLFMALDLGQVGTMPAVTGERFGTEIRTEAPALDARLVALFQAIMLDAVSEGASDVHLERYGDRVRVRLRIDGDLHDITHFHLDPEQMQGVVNVIKVNAGIDIADRRSPQGGRFSITADERAFDLRVQTQPALHGEHVVVRLLPQGAALLRVEDLGFSAEVARSYNRLLQSPSGLMLVVGPTGSGKTTTLYAGLQVLARDTTRKVVTIEDPIEYALDGIQQSQVLPEAGMTFGNAMRVFVRQDPDVIMLGEIRDPETALESLRASQTGHLVLSTLHCNDATDAVQRLLDLNQHPNSVSSELLAVFAQRLAKRNCMRCRADSTPPQDLIEETFPGGLPPNRRFLKGTGCVHCRGLGSKGRVGVVEYLGSTPRLRRAISARAPVDQIRRVALEGGMVPMRDRALELVQQGVIAFDELRSLLPPERLAPEGADHRAAGAAGQ